VTTIKGWTGLLLKADRPEASERRALESIDHQTDRITHLVEDLLHVVRLRGTRPELSRERVDLGDLVRSQVERAAGTAGQHRFHVEADRALVVEADRELVGNVLGHLLENALRYTPSGGVIEVEVRRVGGEVAVSVRDSGPGIPLERRPHVFEPFYEALPSGHPGYTGSVSLGLALSKQIVEAHGGRIWFQSEEGRGTTFSFSLPMASGSSRTGRARRPA
jgi:signal transduction histidine kinase